MAPLPNLAHGYCDTYARFDSPLMQMIRREAYGEDIGQHSWLTAVELREHLVGGRRAVRVFDADGHKKFKS